MNGANGEIRTATIGGTFETLHIGHKEYIRLALEYADRVLIYVTTNEYVTGTKDYGVRPYNIRVKHLLEYLHEIGCADRCEIRRLDKLQDLNRGCFQEKIDIAIVSPEYYELFLQINQNLQQKGKKSFLILVKLRTPDNRNGSISSRNIRHLRPDLLRMQGLT